MVPSVIIQFHNLNLGTMCAPCQQDLNLLEAERRRSPAARVRSGSGVRRAARYWAAVQGKKRSAFSITLRCMPPVRVA